MFGLASGDDDPSSCETLSKLRIGSDRLEIYISESPLENAISEASVVVGEIIELSFRESVSRIGMGDQLAKYD